MNIFATHPDPSISARQHCDVHVIKMVTEAAQLLSSAHVIVDNNQVAYKKSHANHPCALWIRESAENYRWAYEFYCSLLDEYESRFDKMHAAARHMNALSDVPSIPSLGITPFAQAMPEEFRHANPHFAYRRYLRAKLAEWGIRERKVRTTFTRRAVPLFLHNVATNIHIALPEPLSFNDIQEDLDDYTI
jgi:hypothetical protein